MVKRAKLTLDNPDQASAADRADELSEAVSARAETAPVARPGLGAGWLLLIAGLSIASVLILKRKAF